MDRTDTQLLSSTLDPPAVIWLGLSGAHRSGTTIMARILNQHPEVGLFVEYGLGNYIRSVDALFARSDQIETYDPNITEVVSRAAEARFAGSGERDDVSAALRQEARAPWAPEAQAFRQGRGILPAARLNH